MPSTKVAGILKTLRSRGRVAVKMGDPVVYRVVPPPDGHPLAIPSNSAGAPPVPGPAAHQRDGMKEEEVI